MKRGTEAPRRSAEPSNNAGPHHCTKKLSITRADYLLAEWVVIAANRYEGQKCRDRAIRTRAGFPFGDRVRTGFRREAAKLGHIGNAQGAADRFAKILTQLLELRARHGRLRLRKSRRHVRSGGFSDSYHDRQKVTTTMRSGS
ncbi:hypothetical protein SAMN05444158_7094 [Bradyrhizobium canariense]|uniref:Uncharacterized protein n=1 Tax=Bradyrhizobium canariense TaxID=255045 RepID=A0A1H2BFH3_9BRAD|nr:hypothetical protein SAMN05444158_7094 [Bradyrhizobium canariense]